MNNNDLNRKNESFSKAPIFLRKIYDMLETADENLICWSDDGMHFAIKDHERFASEIIPQYFTHNNFSSFVRQLNFHGFRKIKLDPLRISLQQVQLEANYWRYMHKNFRRGRPELLCQVRGRHQNHHGDSGMDPQEYESMKEEVQSLRSQVSELTKDLKSVSSLITKMIQDGSLEFGEGSNEEEKAELPCCLSYSAPPSHTAVTKRFHDDILPVTSSIPEKRHRRDVRLVPDNGSTRYQTSTSESMLPRPATLPNRVVQQKDSAPLYQVSRARYQNLDESKVALEMNFRRAASEQVTAHNDTTVGRNVVVESALPIENPKTTEVDKGDTVLSFSNVSLPTGMTNSIERRDSMASIASIDTELIFRDEEVMKLERETDMVSTYENTFQDFIPNLPPLPVLKPIEDESKQGNTVSISGGELKRPKHSSLPKLSMVKTAAENDWQGSDKNETFQQTMIKCPSWPNQTMASMNIWHEIETPRNVVG